MTDDETRGTRETTGPVIEDGTASPDAVGEKNPPDAAIPGETGSIAGFLRYTLSIPERTLRSGVGLAAGTAREAAQVLVPKSFQTSKSYEIVVRNSLDFMIKDIGGVKEEKYENAAETENYIARKAVGNFVDLAGLATLHVSPLWMLAIVSDVAYGSKSYVIELANELKDQGLIDDTSTIHHVDDVLDALQSASGNTASMFDTPPLSVEQLRASLDQTRKSIQSTDVRTLIPQSELKRYWGEMHEIAARDDVSLLSVSSAMTLHSLERLTTFAEGTLVGVKVAGGLLNRHVLQHYKESLGEIRQHGFYQTVKDSYAPYVGAVWTNFSSEQETWTDEVVTGRLLSRIWQLLKSKLTGRKPGPPVADNASALNPTESSDATVNEPSGPRDPSN